jgi:hypothetical protein
MGPWGIAALIAVATASTQEGRAQVKKLLKTTVRMGYAAKESASELACKAKDYKDELIAEIEAEKDASASEKPREKKKSAKSYQD